MAPEVFTDNKFAPRGSGATAGGILDDDLDLNDEMSHLGPKVDVWALGIILLQAYVVNLFLLTL